MRTQLRAETSDNRYKEIDVDLVLEGALDGAQRAKLLELAGRCTIARTLAAGVAISAH